MESHRDNEVWRWLFESAGTTAVPVQKGILHTTLCPSKGCISKATAIAAATSQHGQVGPGSTCQDLSVPQFPCMNHAFPWRFPQVFDMLRAPGYRGVLCLNLLGNQVCNKAFIRLLSLGKSRFWTLRRSALKGHRTCPLDKRFIPRAKTKPPSKKRSFVFEYLDHLYLTVAESLPDRARNHKRPRSFAEKRDTALTDHQSKRARQLPPGSFRDYLRLCQEKWASVSGDGPISYKLFSSAPCAKWQLFSFDSGPLDVNGFNLGKVLKSHKAGSQVWQRDFGGRLRVRSATQHKKCSTCVKHKLIIAKLNNNEVARRAQIRLYQAHLDRQYKDRMIYWERRGISRLCAQSTPDEATGPVLTCILDSMDASKHAWPRSRALGSKDFQSFVRPRLTHTSVICHGRCVYSILSPPDMPANSSRTVEILGVALTNISKTVDLRRYHVNVQGDNCCREVKNQSTLRMAAVLTSNHLVRSFSVTFLESGHSHEDIDAFFSSVSEWLSRYPELHTADAFVECVQKFLDSPGVRTTEPIKQALMMRQCLNWCL